MEQQEATNPDQLLDTFRGRSLRTIVLFTIVVHVVVILGSSVPFLWRKVAGDTSKLSEDERVKLAVKEATSSLREIADAHGLRPQDLAKRLDGGGLRASGREAAPESADKPAGEPEIVPATEPEKPKSEIEKEIEKVEEGPAVPPVGEEEVDLFK